MKLKEKSYFYLYFISLIIIQIMYFHLNFLQVPYLVVRQATRENTLIL